MIKFPFYFYTFLIDFLLFLNRIVIRKCNSKEEFREISHFIFEIYKSKGYIDQKFFSEESLQDEFDKHSIYFSAFYNKKLIGTIRMIFPSSMGFQIEKFFNISELPPYANRKEIVEISRLCISNKFAKKNIVLFGLLKACFLYSLKKGVKHWYLLTTPKMVSKFKKTNIKFVKIHYKNLTSSHIKAREPHRYFFEKCLPEPYLVSLEQVKKEFKL